MGGIRSTYCRLLLLFPWIIYCSLNNTKGYLFLPHSQFSALVIILRAIVQGVPGPVHVTYSNIWSLQYQPHRDAKCVLKGSLVHDCRQLTSFDDMSLLSHLVWASCWIQLLTVILLFPGARSSSGISTQPRQWTAKLWKTNKYCVKKNDFFV